MSDNANPAHVWELMEKIGFCMLASHEGDEIRSRPMAAYVRPKEGLVYFLTDEDSAKAEDIARQPQVNLAFADTSAMNFVSVIGRASLANDREKIRELFGVPAKAWWDSPEDPAIRVLKVVPVGAYFWDSPGKVVSYAKMAAAAVSSSRPAMGEHGSVDMAGERV
jgi:general stress protein 26